jgi:hypothetical protein
MSDQHDTAVEREEPWWLVVAKLDEDEFATTAVDAPDEGQARAEGERVIAGGEGSDEFEVRSVRGPFPRSPGAAAPEVRPGGCHGCDLGCWDGNDAPVPGETWFDRESEDEETVGWRCITCGTVAYKPKEAPA